MRSLAETVKGFLTKKLFLSINRSEIIGNSKFEIRQNSFFLPNFRKWHSSSEFGEQNLSVWSNIRRFDPRTRCNHGLLKRPPSQTQNSELRTNRIILRCILVHLHTIFFFHHWTIWQLDHWTYRPKPALTDLNPP